jgi:hypothetical protein
MLWNTNAYVVIASDDAKIRLRRSVLTVYSILEEGQRLFSNWQMY